MTKQTICLFVLYLFASKFLKITPLSHNAATNQINAIGVVLTGSVRASQMGCGGQCDSLCYLFLPKTGLHTCLFGALFIFDLDHKLKRFGRNS